MNPNRSGLLFLLVAAPLGATAEEPPADPAADDVSSDFDEVEVEDSE